MSEIRNLQVMVPIELTDAMIISGTTQEDANPLWVSGVTYAIGDKRYRPNHRVYRRITVGGGTLAPENDAANWQDFGPTNRHALFDGKVSTPTIQTNSLTLVLRPGFFNAFAILGVEDCTGLTVTVRDAPNGNVIYHLEDDMEGSEPEDWYEYWYQDFFPEASVLIDNIEPFYNAELTITLTSLTSIKVGMVAVGDMRNLGRVLHGSQARFVDYSYVDIDPETGENFIEPGPSARDLQISAWMPLSEAKVADRTLQELLSFPCVWVCGTDDNFAGLRTYGLGNGVISYDDPRNCSLSLDVKGLI